MEFISNQKVKTRKPHKCWGCTEDIPVGTTAVVAVSKEDGEITSSYWCDRCDTFMNNLDSFDRQDGFLFGELLNFNNYPKPKA